MKKFLVLLKKEIRELATLQTIMPILLILVVFLLVGNIINKEQKKESGPQVIGVIDQDHTSTSDAIISTLEKANFTVKVLANDLDPAISQVQSDGGSALLVIPVGFQASIQATTPESIQTYTILRNFSVTGASSYATVKAALSALNDYFSNQLITAQIPTIKPETLKNPITTTDFVQVSERRAQANPEALFGFVTQQVTFIPIVLFLIIMLAAQIIATAVATEKENKTLETLLSLPINRTSIILAKMLAAGLVGLVSSVAYMIGFRSYLNSITGGAASDPALHTAAAQLGLVLTPMNYFIIGLALFFAILIALVIAMILGAFAEDVKSLQTLIMPLTISLMIPYLLTLLVDINSASPALRDLVYIIPFSQAFLAAPNLFLHNYSAVGYGILYEIVVFIALMYVAVRIFATDRIVTMKLSFGKKRS